jgi:hypothetical protein
VTQQSVGDQSRALIRAESVCEHHGGVGVAKIPVSYERTHIFTTVRAESARCHGMEALLVGYVNYAEGAQLCIALLAT